MYDDLEKTRSAESYSQYNNGGNGYNQGGYTPGRQPNPGYPQGNVQYNGGYGSGYDNYPQNNGGNSSNNVIIAIIVVALVIILGLGGVVAFVFVNKNNEDKENKKEPVTTTVQATESTAENETQPATTAVVVVEGYKSDDAYQVLNNAGIKYDISREYSDTVPEDYVISQSPKDGFIKDGDKIKLYISKGSKDKPVTQPPQSSVSPPVYNPPVSSYSSDYIIPDSSSRYLSEAEVKALSRDRMNLALNEIYARHGRRFKSSALQSYFNSKSWYSGTVDPATFDSNIYSYLNSIEIANVNLIDKIQKQLGYKY